MLNLIIESDAQVLSANKYTEEFLAVNESVARNKIMSNLATAYILPSSGEQADGEYTFIMYEQLRSEQLEGARLSLVARSFDLNAEGKLTEAIEKARNIPGSASSVENDDIAISYKALALHSNQSFGLLLTFVPKNKAAQKSVDTLMARAIECDNARA